MRGSPASAWLATREDTIVQEALVGLVGPDGGLQVWSKLQTITNTNTIYVYNEGLVAQCE
jgi:hypothetical protein